MSIEHCILPEHYRSLLNQKETQMAIKLVKDTFERKLADNLRLIRVSAPLFVEAASGLNDNLNGVERPVHFRRQGNADGSGNRSFAGEMETAGVKTI